MTKVLAILAISAALLPAQLATKKMADGRVWTTVNLNSAVVSPSYCYDDREANCVKYGRLYTWESAQAVCRTLGAAWKLPSNEDWRRLVTSYGPLREESLERAKIAFDALMTGGSSGFDVVLGGGRSDTDHTYARGDAHGFYWTSTESGPNTAWMYNLGRNGQVVNRHKDIAKPDAYSVRCIRE